MGLLIDSVNVSSPSSRLQYLNAPFLIDTGAVYTIVSRRVAMSVGLTLGAHHNASVYGGKFTIPGRWSTAFIELASSQIGVTLNVFVPDSQKPTGVLGMDYLKLTNTVIRIGSKTYRFNPTWPNPESLSLPEIGFLPDIRDKDFKTMEEAYDYLHRRSIA